MSAPGPGRRASSPGRSGPPHRRADRLFGSLVRYALALAGTAGTAGAQFILSLMLLKLLPPTAFGRFSFLLVASQLSWGIWGALFCAPLPILLADADPARRAVARGCLMATNLFAGIAALPPLMVMAWLLGERPGGAALFAVYGVAALIRWFARAYAYAEGQPMRTVSSDLLYTAVLLGSTAFLWSTGIPSLDLAWSALLLATVAALFPFGRAYLAAQFAHVRPSDVRPYPAIWRSHARWALSGVLTTEATANAHSYLVTLILGPTAFAPVAASALLIRPVNVASNALTEFERARMARDLGERRVDRVLAALPLFRTVLIGVWIATAVATAALLAGAPRLVFPARYPMSFLTPAAALWLAVALMRLLRTPDSALLQASGAFRPLAGASLWSGALSLAAVLALLIAGGPLWSIAGILVGETLFAALLWRQSREWRRAAMRPLANP